MHLSATYLPISFKICAYLLCLLEKSCIFSRFREYCSNSTYFLKKGFCFSNAFHLLHIFEHSLLLDFKVGKLHNAYIISSIVCESKVKKLENNHAWAVYWTNDSYKWGAVLRSKKRLIYLWRLYPQLWRQLICLEKCC